MARRIRYSTSVTVLSEEVKIVPENRAGIVQYDCSNIDKTRILLDNQHITLTYKA